MAEKQHTPTISSNKLAMSRALGAAFLNHQVEQLEKSVSNGPSSGNWRARRAPPANHVVQVPQGGPKRVSPTGIRSPTKKLNDAPIRHERGQPREKGETKNIPLGLGPRRLSSDEENDGKNADIIVVDASVLVHALYQVKKWCRDNRNEIIIIPLEALNTLDLLKKGTSSLAQRARAASRILEAQVGANPRIRVQQDDAFVLWEKIEFKEGSEASERDNNHLGHQLNTSPEWVRRTICCARWEVDNGNITPRDDQSKSRAPITKPKVALAVLSSPPNISPRLQSLKLSDNAESPLTPVPLPAPPIPHANKYELRSSGTLVSHWAARAGIDLLEIAPTMVIRGPEEEDRFKRPQAHGSTNRRPPPATEISTKAALVERPPAVKTMMEIVSQPSKVVRVLARGEKLDPDP